ncbi:MAG: hypothetical protein ACTSWN_01840 [Promethearchaeota archaeon]
MRQILEIFMFDIKRQKKKYIIILILAAIVDFFQNLLPYWIIGQPKPETAMDYVSNSLGLFNIILLFTTALFAGSAIANEFDKKTGIIIFPKTGKTRLFIGRTLSSYLGVITLIIAYYSTNGLITLAIYHGTDGLQDAAIAYSKSFGFACLFGAAMVALCLLFSSMFKKGSIAIIMFVIIYWIGLNIAGSIVPLINPDVEPLFSLSYAETLISNIMNMPDERFIDIPIQAQPGENASDVFTVRTWLTPTIPAGIMICVVYLVASILISYLLFIKKEI